MDFITAENQFRQLTYQYEQQRISIEQYRTEISQLQVTDAYGRTWMLQEGSGQWFVFHDNQWIASDPHQLQTQNESQPHNKKPNKNWLIAGMVLAVIVCLLAATAAGGYWLYRNGKLAFLDNFRSPTTQLNNSASQIDLSVNQVQNYTFQAGQEQEIDSNGAKIKIPDDALDSGVSAKVFVSDPGSQLQKIVSDVFQTQTRFYEVIADGENDGTGWATVTVPAGGGEPYLMEVIDGKFIALTSLQGSTGNLTFQVPIGSAASAQGDESVRMTGTSQFAVLQAPLASNLSSFGHLASAAPQVDPRSCGIDNHIKGTPYMSKIEYQTMSFCRKNIEGTIQVVVYPPDTPNVTPGMVDPIVDTIEEIMKAYENEGFSAAKLEDRWRKRLRVEIDAGSGDPYYSSAIGIVHIPEDSVKKSGSQDLRFELAHELAHWVQDSAYNFTSSYWANWTGISSTSKWWLEVSAENMTFIYNSTAVERNLTMYGMTTPADAKTPFQFSPDQWNDQLYIHAQLVKVFMCENSAVCPINQNGFVAAINNGTFPYDAAAIAKVTANLKEFARYLLGKPPQNANPVIPIMPAVSSGSGYGEFVNAKGGGVEVEYQKTGYQPQMQEVKGEFGKTIKISASVEKGAVYPLVIKGPINAQSAGLPIEIKISAGTPFYYRLGDGDIQFSDGTKEIVLGPVHPTMGLEKVRIVAVASDAAKTFLAIVQPINLNGDWLLFSKHLLSHSIRCEDMETVTIHPEESATVAAVYTSFPAAVAGVYSLDSGGISYTWSGQSGADLTFGGDTAIELAGIALLTNDGIKLQNKLTIPEPQTNNAPAGPLVSGIGISSLMGALFLKKQRKKLLSLLVILNLVLLSSCSGGFGGFYGTYSNDIIFTKIETAGNKSSATIYQEMAGGQQNGEDNVIDSSGISGVVPRYVLTGISNATMDITVVTWVSTTDSTDTITNRCNGTLQYEVIGMIVDDGQIITLFPEE